MTTGVLDEESNLDLARPVACLGKLLTFTFAFKGL